VVAEAAYQRGFAALEAGDYPTARRELVEAQKGLPRDPFVALDLGVVCQHLGDRTEAEAQYRRVLETGRDVYPRRVTDPGFSGETLAGIARADLATLGE
jgi:Tfp pilus assembly protein PilF